MVRRTDQPSERVPAPFIVGAGRSGTTLLRLMLDAHPELAIPPETHFIPVLERNWRTTRWPRAAAIDVIVNNQRWADFHLDADAFAAEVRASADSATDVLRLFYSSYAARHGKPRWGDKTPAYAMSMPLIAELLPEAHFVHMIRDGRDVALSVRAAWFGPDTIEDAAHWWVDRVQTARRDGAELPYLEIRYERLVDDPAAELERVCRFLGLAFVPEMLSAHERADTRLAEEGDLVSEDVPVADRRAIHERLVRPPGRDRVGRWTKEMTAAEREAFEAVAGPLLRELGY